MIENNIIYTPSNILADIDLKLDSEITIIKETQKEGVTLKEIYFSAREIEGKRPRGYGILAFIGKNAPLLVIIGDLNHSIDQELMLYYTKLGFNVFMFDYTGEDEFKTKYTFYPQEIDYANLSRADRHLNFADKTARKTCIFEWTLLSYYAVTAAKTYLEKDVKTGLLGIGKGGEIVWILSSFDKRISAYCTVFSAGWDAYDKIYKYGKNNTLTEIDAERERWLAGISSENYAKLVNAPMMFLSSTNSDKTHIERAYDTVNRIPKEIDKYICISAKLNNTLCKNNKQNIKLFFEKYLLNKNIELPQKSNIIIENKDNKIAVILSNDNENIKKVNVFYSENEINPVCRNWQEYNAELKNNNFIAYPFINTNDLIFVYANITYKNGFTQSTNLCVKKISDLKTDITSRRKMLLYNNEMGKDSFTVYYPENNDIKKVLLYNDNIELKAGAGIKGISSTNNCIATYKIGDINYKGQNDESFKFDVYSLENQEFIVSFYNKTDDKQEEYSYKCQLTGGNIWNPIQIKKENIKTSEGVTLKTWENISIVCFYAKNEFLINNILWI